MNQIFLDTNALSQYFEDDPQILEEVKISHLVNISVVTIGEIVYGFLKGNRFDKNNAILNKFLTNQYVNIVKINKEIAYLYAQIFFQNRKNGIPVPINDIWIAASAIETNSTLITYDKHFLKIPKVKLWKKLY
jgi:predicted nucleic acid-binding protein